MGLMSNDLARLSPAAQKQVMEKMRKPGKYKAQKTKRGKLTFDTSKPDGTMRKLTDPGKLHALGWHHKIDIEEGVQRMYRWYLGK